MPVGLIQTVFVDVVDILYPKVDYMRVKGRDPTLPYWDIIYRYCSLMYKATIRPQYQKSPNPNSV